MAQSRSRRTRAHNAMPEEHLNQISCEVCRQRKCKCDRRLPFCSQCAGEPSKCIYPESGKRGLPLGYLNQLEQRLAETESALYGALMSLRSLGQSTSVQVAVKSDNVPKQKAARMAEWSQLPLRERIDMERWLTMMSDQFTIEPPRDVVPESSGDRSEIPATPHLEKEQSLGDEPRVGRVFNAWQPRDGGVSSGSPYSPHQCHPRMMGSLVYFGHPAVEGSEALQSPSAGSSRRGMTGVDDVGLPMDTDAVASGVETGQSSKADELSHNNPSLYF